MSSQCAPGHPRGMGIMLLTAFLGSATVPALHFWISKHQATDLEANRERIEASLNAPERKTESAIPERWKRRIPAPDWFTLGPAEGQPEFDSELLFSSRDVELFERKRSREGEFADALGSLAAPEATVTAAGVALHWEAPKGMTKVRTELADNPLLDLKYRVYRWREGEEPRLLTTIEVSQIYHLDTGLPLWKERFFYCVATVLEGTIDDLPTLMETAHSPVITVETSQNFEVHVLGGTESLARLEVAAFREGGWIRKTFAVTPGGRVGVDNESEDSAFDTGLRVTQIVVREERGEVSVQRPIFLSDGRREVDSISGLPTYRTDAEPVSSRFVEVHCEDRDQTIQTFTSPPLH